MRNRSITLVRFIFLLALSTLLGSLIIFGTHKVSAELNSSSVIKIALPHTNRTGSNSVHGTVIINQAGLTLVKSAIPTTYSAIGTTIDYSYEVTNSGDVDFAGPVTVTDDKATVTCPDGGLTQGAQMTCTASYNITQTDLDSGSVTNTATAHANGTDSNTDDETVTATQNPHLSLTKLATEANYSAAGVTLHYTLVATNDGNVTLTAVSITDAKLGALTCTQPVTLAPLATLTCTDTYVTTQADVDAGKVDNTANASGSFNLTTVNAAPASESVPATQTPLLSLSKLATEANFNAAGVTLHYTLVATNSGNVTLTVVSITDVKLGALTCSQPVTLAPASTLTCTDTYVTTQADVNFGRVDNTANASGTFGLTTVNAAPASESVPATQTPLLTLSKLATEASFNAPGVTLHYTLVATNSGNVTLTAVSITDVKLGTLTCTQPVTLAPLATLTCTDTYVTTQADVNFGRVDNTANASGTFNLTTVNAPPASESVPAIQTPALTLTKLATEPSFSAAGVTLHYTLVATNSGNVTLTAVSITDVKLGVLTCSQPVTLAPAATLTCTDTYLTTQADVNFGRVDNTANASGMNGTTPVNALAASESVPAIQTPALTLTKVATELSFSAAGVTLHYTLVATNNGNVTLTNVSITDVKLGVLTCSQPATLAPLGTLTCTDTYLTTLVDMNAGKVDNTANASGMNGLTPVNAPAASKSVPAIQTPALTITKTATPTVYDYVGQVIGYSFKVENTGNVTLTAPFTVFDDKTTNETCPPTPTTLDPGPPGQFITCTASYTILRHDINSGSVTNAAYATGKFGNTTVTSNTGTETIRARQTLVFAFLPSVSVLRPGVHVLPVSFTYESHGSMFVIGEVLNNTSDSLTSVEVAVNFFNANGLLLDTSHTYIWPIDLPAWEKGCFKITMDVLPAWSYYQFETPTYTLRGTSSGLTIFNHSGLYNSSTGAYDITGQVRNDGSQHSLSVGVSGTLYNIYGVPVGCEHKTISPDLAPGQVSSFSINYSSYYRSYSDVARYKLRVAGDLP